MLPEGLITFSEFEIERAARVLFVKRPRVDFAPPINMEKLVEGTKDVQLAILDGLRFNHRIEGFVCKQFMSHELTVYVDQFIYSGPWPHYNEVLGEEFAHIILHRACFYWVNSIEDFIELQQDPQWPRFERDAKKFSAAVRMPSELVIQEAETGYGRIINEHGFDDVQHVEKLLRNDLAAKFRATPAEMQRRMSSVFCNVNERLAVSFHSRSMELVPDSWTITAHPPIQQQPLFD